MGNVYTSNYKSIPKILDADPNACLIAVSEAVPEDYTGHWMKELAPKKDWLEEWHEKFKDKLNSKKSIAFYSEKYKSTVLNKLNPKTIADKMKKLAGDNNIYLLCYEDVLNKEFCHRQLISSWFLLVYTTGIGFINEVTDEKLADIKERNSWNKYIVINTESDYDCGAPWIDIVGKKLYDTWEEAYDAMVADILETFKAESIEELEREYDIGIPKREDKDGSESKTATAYVNSDDGPVYWDIQKMKG